tara:strand:- start:42 stop:329 length:288 start_codon:yes stop_codon:yes gene_type:complete
VVPLDDFKAHCIAKTLLHAKGRKVEAGRILNITQVTLFSYIERFQIKWVERWYRTVQPIRQLRDCFEYKTVGGDTRLAVGERLDNRYKRFYKGKK